MISPTYRSCSHRCSGCGCESCGFRSGSGSCVSPAPEWSESDFNFFLTEGQSRRGLLIDCNSDCSEIFDYLFVGGAEVARSRETLLEKGITRIINCSASIIDNFFVGEPEMKYLSLNMVDGRQDDISWFLGDVFHFILSGKAAGEKVLLHCERGVSRSCSFAIAYHMWITGCPWMDSFNFVKSKRICCAPNTAFTCHLIEINECLRSDFKCQNIVLYRLASHLLTDDPNTPVLKMCRNKLTRKFIVPKSSIFDPRGVYVLKTADQKDESFSKNQNGQIRCNSKDYEKCADGRGLGSPYPLYLWRGNQASHEAYTIALGLAEKLLGVFTSATHIEVVNMGEEPQGFLDNIFQDGMFSRIDNESECYDDLFTHYIPFEEMEMREYFTGHNESERRSYFHRGLSLRSIGSVGVNTIITTGSTGFDGMDSYDTRDGDLTPSLRSRSDSGGSVDMFYDYSNSSDDDSEYDTPRTPQGSLVDTVIGSDGDGGRDKHYINLGSIEKGESADAVDTDDYDSDYSDAEERTDRMYSTSGTGTTDRDSNTPRDFCGTPTSARGRGGKPPLSPKSGQGNSTVLKRLSRAASKYGISLNLNLNLNSARFRVHQAGNREYEENIFKKTNDERSDCHTDSYGSSEQGSVAGDDCQSGKQCQLHPFCHSTQSTCDSDLDSYKRSARDYAITSTSRRGDRAQAHAQIVLNNNTNITDTDINRENNEINKSKDSSCLCLCPAQDSRSNNTLTHPDENHTSTHCT